MGKKLIAFALGFLGFAMLAGLVLSGGPTVLAMHSQYVTVGGTVKSVSADGKEITLSIGSGGAAKEETFRVDTRTRITLDGTSAKLDDVIVGAKVTLTYDKTTKLVASIRAANAAEPVKKLDKPETRGGDKGIVQASEEIARQIIATYKPKTREKRKVAVLQFSDMSGRTTRTGQVLAEELVTKLFRSNQYEVVERLLLNKLITEHKLLLQGFLDPESAKELGRIAGVDAIVSGSIADGATSSRVNARLVSTETGEIVAVAAASIGGADDLRYVDEAAADIRGQIVETHKQQQADAKVRIAVLDFSDLDSVAKTNVLGQLLSEELITELFVSSRYEVVERLLLSKLMSEHKLAREGLIDPKSAKEIGRVLGVHAIVTGTISHDANFLRVNARLISSDTGSIAAVASTSIPNKPSLIALLKNSNANRTGAREGTFFFEDFSGVEPGLLPAGWTADKTLAVLKDGNRRVLGTFELDREHKLYGGAVTFPDNFRFEWVLYFEFGHELRYTMTIGSVAVSYDADIRGNSYITMNNSKCTVPLVRGDATLKLGLEKQGTVFRTYLDDKEVLLARYEQYKNGTGFTFTAKDPDGKSHFKILRIVGITDPVTK